MATSETTTPTDEQRLRDLAAMRREVERGRTTYAGDLWLPQYAALTSAIEAGADALAALATLRAEHAAVSEGRKRELLGKADEARDEWTRAEAEAERDRLREALGRMVMHVLQRHHHDAEDFARRIPIVYENGVPVATLQESV